MVDKHDIEDSNELTELEGQSTEEFSLDDMMGELDEPESSKAESKVLAREKEEKNRKFAGKINGTFWWSMSKLTPRAVKDVPDEYKTEGVEALMPLAEKMDGEVPEWIMKYLEKYDWAIAGGAYFGPTVAMLIKEEKAARAKEAANDETPPADKETGTDGS